MLKDIVGLNLKGASFISDTSLKLFDPIESNKTKNVKGTLLYGRNGAGKSTIARAIKKTLGVPNLPISTALFYDVQENTVILTEDEKKHIFVFDEDYVSSKVRLMESGLGTIVMLGEQVDLTAQIEEAERQLETAKTALNEAEATYRDFSDSSSENSPEYYLTKMNLSLSGDGNWAGRDREIHQNRRNTSVRNDTYKRFIDLSPERTRDELIVAYEVNKQALLNAQNGLTKLTATINPASGIITSFKYEEAAELVNKAIEKPVLSEREQYLFSLVQQGKSAVLYNSANYFRKPEAAFCPTCLQDITSEYKEDLVAKIEKVLSKAVEDHQTALRALMLETYNGLLIRDLSCLSSYTACEAAIEALNNAIVNNNEIIQEKIDNPYTIPEGQLIDIVPLGREVEKQLNLLSEEKIEYNKKITNTQPIISTLENINAEIAHYDIKDYYEKYLTQKEKADKSYRFFKDAGEIEREKRQKLDDLKAERSNIRIATDVLNRAFKYVFFSDNRLSIQLEDDQYKLLSNGNSVKPCDVSVGERNIIGLCYFFVSIFEGKEEQQTFKEEHLIVIDDPISSYDFENRIGILSYIKYELNRFLINNPESRALVLTHDLSTFYDIEKIFNEILKQFDKTYKFNIYELKNQSLTPFLYKKRQEYTELIQAIYNYANGNATEFDIVIGNIMRQALEAFATFTYKKGIEDVSTDHLILEEIDEKYRDYFENLMYRLVLNGGSHREEQARNLELDFYSMVSEQEKRRTARDILCFIYLLNKRHLLSHLPDNVGTVIEGWCTQIVATTKTK